jgi:hypothetical protein
VINNEEGNEMHSLYHTFKLISNGLKKLALKVTFKGKQD